MSKTSLFWEFFGYFHFFVDISAHIQIYCLSGQNPVYTFGFLSGGGNREFRVSGRVYRTK